MNPDLIADNLKFEQVSNSFHFLAPFRMTSAVSNSILSHHMTICYPTSPSYVNL